MTTRTITAMFSTRQEAEMAGEKLVSQLGLDRSMVRITPDAGVTDTGYDTARPYEEKGFFGALKELFVPDEDRFAYAEGMRRGSVLLSATVNETEVNAASDLLEHAGAMDLDAQEATWKESGWTGYDAVSHSSLGVSSATAQPVATAQPAGVAQNDTIKVVQERLVVGKRQVDSGRVKVRAYVVERPVEETVRLHEESVHVERRPVDRVATPGDLAAFEERTIEAHATSEEAVVGKEARVVEEIGIHKQASDRSETVHDTVRETKVDVEDTASTTRAAGTTGVASTVDRTLHTNVSGTNPAADAPDGTPGNPPGTMASRAVDKTLGTNISGANPGHK